jgi:hypothetical protein
MENRCGESDTLGWRIGVEWHCNSFTDYSSIFYYRFYLMVLFSSHNEWSECADTLPRQVIYLKQKMSYTAKAIIFY